MENENLQEKVQGLFRQAFHNPDLAVNPETTAADVAGWDSITHIDLILLVEREFQMQFSTAELSRMRNVGDFLRVIAEKRVD